MKIRIKATEIEMTPYLKDMIKEKLAEISKHLRGKRAIIAEIELGVTSRHHQKGDIYRAEMQIEIPGRLFRAVSEKEDFRSALTDAKNEIEKQIRRHKDKKVAEKRRVPEK
ncbi:MAG: ribosome-associated translation inhibitor RaiA [Candidatus Pacebacteria bacterium]|nr:ribosome-associated translation inhibitor RaiA [Candidatus Paceibacterota bacterium]